MSRKIDTSKGLDRLSKEDLLYLDARGQLTADQRRQFLGDATPEPPTPRALEEQPHTGDTGRVDEQTERLSEDGRKSLGPEGSDRLGPDDYEDATNAELRDELRARGLPTSGSKSELLERLEDDDEESEGGEEE